MRNIHILMIAALASGAVLTGCSGTDNDDIEHNETQQESRTSSPANQRPPLNENPAAPYGHEEDTTENLTSANIGGTAMVPSNSIVQNAESNPELSTFVGAVRQAGLVRALNGTGPYTVFAPSNEAFEALPGDVLEDLMKPENKQQLVALVNNHIVAGKLNAKGLQSGSSITTAGNGQVKVAAHDDRIMVNGAHVEMADIVSSNGVIHVVDKVLVPEKK